MGYPNQKIANFLEENSLYITKNNNNRVILWRHGRTLANVKKIICGSGGASFNVPLDEIGELEAQSQISTLKSLLRGVDKKSIIIFSSPQPRGIKTASILTNWTGKDIKILDFLKEVNVGKFEGKPYTSRSPILDKNETTPRTGDLYINFCKEVNLGIKNILRYCHNKTILISTHGTTGSIINQSLSNGYIRLGNVDLLEYDKKLKLVTRHKPPTRIINI